MWRWIESGTKGRIIGRTMGPVMRGGVATISLLSLLSQGALAQRQETSAFRPPSLLAAGDGGAVAAGSDGPAADTTRRRPVAIEYSDWYGRRLKVHQIASWTMLPLFAVQYAAGQQLLDKGRYGAPSWARDLHSPLAASLGILFAVNTVTGGWNLWDARKDPAARKWRTAHAVLMLVADAGFALTPAFADNEGSGSNLKTHRNVAVASMGIATVSWLMMLPPFRHE